VDGYCKNVNEFSEYYKVFLFSSEMERIYFVTKHRNGG